MGLILTTGPVKTPTKGAAKRSYDVDLVTGQMSGERKYSENEEKKRKGQVLEALKK